MLRIIACVFYIDVRCRSVNFHLSAPVGNYYIRDYTPKVSSFLTSVYVLLLLTNEAALYTPVDMYALSNEIYFLWV